MNPQGSKRLYTVEEVREAVGHDRLSLHLAYALARVKGFKLGRRWLLPAHVVEELLEGRLPEEVLNQAHQEARRRSRGEA
ncbi:hypothetical protein [Thermus sp.]|uniref:hypothetical protein n=1 Tax=Thermus sp. TaxID=275 RepID=UPI0025EA623E|nr:hypothetical protein [Thermus sp.]MCS6867807.1 hypothetical protein [Thermus sp.]MDW8358682.1 hypothetical protein [Thermus sp.]